MADNTTGLPVQTLAGQFVSTKLVDTGGTNVATVSAAGALKVDGSAVTQPVSGTVALAAGAANIGDVDVLSVPAPLSTTGSGTEATALRVTVATDSTGVLSVDDNGASLTIDAPVASPAFVRLSDGAAALIGQAAMAASVPVVLASNQTSIPVTLASTTITGTVAATQSGTWTVQPGNTANTVPWLASIHDGTTKATVRDLASNDALNVAIVDGSGNQITSFAGGTQYVGDAAATATPTTTLVSALANAAAPTDVSANNDAVALWALRNGALVVNEAAGGTLLTMIGQAAASAKFVRINDGTTTAGVIVGTTALKTDISSIAGTAPGATAFVPSRLTDGTAYYTKTGQAAGTASFAQLSDQTNVVNVIAATNALKVDISSIAGTAPGATVPLAVRLTDGAAFYSAGSSAPVDPKFSAQTSAALGAGASVRVNHYVTSGKTGQLVGIDAGSTVPCKVEIQTIVTGTPTTRVVLFTKPFEVYQWRSPFKTFITRASADATSGFSVTFTNKDGTIAADVYSTGYWDEI